MTIRQRMYQEYLKGEHWKQLRSKVLTRDGFKCAWCASASRLQVHHLKYRSKFEDSTPEDLVTLCSNCHRGAHGILAKVDFFFKLRIGDYIADTLGLTKSEQGAHLLSLMHYWKKGGPLTDSELRKICGRQFKRVSSFYRFKEGLWHNLGIDEEMRESEIRVEKAKAKAILVANR